MENLEKIADRLEVLADEIVRSILLIQKAHERAVMAFRALEKNA